jgi:hypothetical protein
VKSTARSRSHVPSYDASDLVMRAVPLRSVQELLGDATIEMPMSRLFGGCCTTFFTVSAMLGASTRPVHSLLHRSLATGPPRMAGQQGFPGNHTAPLWTKISFDEAVRANRACVTTEDCAVAEFKSLGVTCVGVNRYWWETAEHGWNEKLSVCRGRRTTKNGCCSLQCDRGRCRGVRESLSGSGFCALEENLPSGDNPLCSDGDVCWAPPEDDRCWRGEGSGMCVRREDARDVW